MMEKITPMYKNVQTPDSRLQDDYDTFAKLVEKSCTNVLNTGKPLFRVNISSRHDHSLADIYLLNLPEDGRQHYNCNCCKRFINKYGRLAIVQDDGSLTSVMWNMPIDEVPEFFRESVSMMKSAVETGKIDGSVILDHSDLGVVSTGEWTHLHATTPKDFTLWYNGIKTAYERSCELNENYSMLVRALAKYNTDVLNQAVNILRSDELYKADGMLDMATWVHSLTLIKNRNILRMKAAEKPNWCHVSSSMIGTLLDDIVDGLPLDTIRERFNQKMDPLKYKRPQVAPTTGNIKRAEEIVAALGIADSLKRRYAKLDELTTIWTPKEEVTSESETTGIFGMLKAKDSKPEVPDYIPTKKIRWDDFVNNILPTAISIKVLVSNFDRFCAITAPEVENSPNIMRWDNPYCWYTYDKPTRRQQWNIDSHESYLDVTAICYSPDDWNSSKDSDDKVKIAILKGCKDTAHDNIGNALFPACLIGELMEIRSTIEAYSKESRLSGFDEANACGILFKEYSKFMVTDSVGTMYYDIK